MPYTLKQLHKSIRIVEKLKNKSAATLQDVILSISTLEEIKNFFQNHVPYSHENQEDIGKNIWYLNFSIDKEMKILFYKQHKMKEFSNVYSEKGII